MPHYVKITGLDIRVSVAGEGRPLLLVNGLGGNIESWGPLTRMLPEHQVITFDAPGTGKSATPPVPLSMAGHARLASRVIEALGFERVDVLGLSFGGGVAQTLAYRHPDRVSSLILAATGCGWGGVPGNPLALSLLTTPYRYFSRSHYRAVAPILFGGTGHRREGELGDYIASRTSLRPSVWGYYSQLFALAGWSSFPWLHRIPHPTLVLLGDDDPLVPVANAHLMARRIPNAEVRVIPGGGHLFLWEDASASAEIILDFLSRSRVG
jgi:poly(3-hydroxyalkanoate) depolymerase